MGTVNLKKRLLEEGVLPNACILCGLGPEWNGKPMVLRLDHINGVRDDARIENLRMVCPNCDSQLPTFAGRNKGRNRPYAGTGFCAICEKPIGKMSTHCVVCVHRAKPQATKIQWPTKEELEFRLKLVTWAQLGRELGVSPLSIKLRLGVSKSD